MCHSFSSPWVLPQNCKTNIQFLVVLLEIQSSIWYIHSYFFFDAKNDDVLNLQMKFNDVDTDKASMFVCRFHT